MKYLLNVKECTQIIQFCYILHAITHIWKRSACSKVYKMINEGPFSLNGLNYEEKLLSSFMFTGMEYSRTHLRVLSKTELSQFLSNICSFNILCFIHFSQNNIIYIFFNFRDTRHFNINNLIKVNLTTYQVIKNA